MKRQQVLALAFVALLATPAAIVGAAGQADSSNTSAASADDVAASQAAAEAAAASSDGGEVQSQNYTQLYVENDYRSLQLKPGESDSFNVSVENGEDEAVTLSPHVFVPQLGQRPVEESWVSISDEELTLESDEEATVTVEVEVPDDADLGRYSGSVAFTNETITYPGRPAHPVHSANFNVEVAQEPTVKVHSERYGTTQVQAGESATHQIVVENTGDQAVPVNPQVHTENSGVHLSTSRDTLERSWFEIDAPSEVEPGETATVNVTVSPPADADRGRYQTEIDLGLKDPARPDDSGYWQQTSLDVQVWKQPDEPFETEFDVAEGTENATLTIDASDRYRSDDDTPAPNFDVTFVAPNGTTVDAERVEVTDSGHVNLGQSEEPRQNGAYATDRGQQQFTYRVDEPAAGEWSVRIMPHNAIQFGYEITRDES